MFGCLTRNIQKLHATNQALMSSRDKENSTKQLKVWYLFYLMVAGATRIASLITLINRPGVKYQYIFYTFPIIFWLNA